MTQKLTNAELLDKFLNDYPADRLEFRPASESWCYESVPISQGELIKRLAHQMDVYNTRVSNMLAEATAMRREDARRAIDEYVKERDRLPEDDSELHKWMRLMEHANTDSVTHEATMQAVKQWMWAVKRHTLKMAVQWPVAPIFWSVENGTGKSYNIRRMIKPFEAYTRHIDVNELGEKFSGRMFAETLIAFLDEFAGVEKANVAQLKAILTGKPIDRRAMHSETGFFAENRMSCIATSNLEPPHGFVDHSGMRRFWSIQCSGVHIAEDQERKAEFDAIDYKAVWRAISASSPAPQDTCDPEVKSFMEGVRHKNLRTKTSLENFVEDRIEKAETNMPLKEFQYQYKTYCSQTRQLVACGSYAKLSSALTQAGFTVTRPNNVYFLKNQRLIPDDNDCT